MMRKKSVLRQLPLTLSVIALAALIAFVWYATDSLKTAVIDHMRDELRARTYLVADHVASEALFAKEDSLQELVRALGRGTQSRVTIVDPAGKVVGDSRDVPATMENHAERPEVAGALRGKFTWSIRYSATLGMNMMYAALPIQTGGRIIGVARVSIELKTIDDFARMLERRVIIGGSIITIVSALLIYLGMRRITRPIGALREGAEQFARGNFAHRLPLGESGEFASLVESMTEMARQLDERIHTILHQRNEQEAVLSSMIEGVIAIDLDERILNLNKAAARLFNVSAEGATGKSIHEVIRNIDVQRFAARALDAKEAVGDIITLREGEDRHLQAHGTALHGSNGQIIGAVIVVHDITQLRRLESIRRDFVANVSHELKTPVTSIKGFVETLQDGAMDDVANRERFLAIIAKEADRLHNIIEDLLSLSRIEQEAERLEILMERGRVRDTIDAAVQACDAHAKEKSITVRIDCDAAIEMRMNAQLIEQALSNLIDNAIKYSETGTSVTVSAERIHDFVSIRVMDLGPGIPAEHLGRIFERFYRVDKARSRKSGSTGLGLAIVKHIVQAHNGQVTVESAPGSGSTFSIVLPLSPDPRFSTVRQDAEADISVSPTSEQVHHVTSLPPRN